MNKETCFAACRYRMLLNRLGTNKKLFITQDHEIVNKTAGKNVHKIK